MQERTLGKSNLRISVIGLGCNNFGERVDLNTTRAIIHKALDLGITFFDTADVYGREGRSEEFLGQALNNRRKDIILATKFGVAMVKAKNQQPGSRRYILSAIEGSLKRLKTDWIDLYQMHLPDPLTPIEETLRALDDIIRQGKVRYIGCSNFSATQIVEAQTISQFKNLSTFISCQDELSLIARNVEQNIVPTLETYNLGLIPYLPLAGGFLTDKYRRNMPMPMDARITLDRNYHDRYLTEENWSIVESLREFAKERSHTLLELAFSWLITRPYVASIIAGATRPDQLERNAVAADWRLTTDDLKVIDAITRYSC